MFIGTVGGIYALLSISLHVIWGLTGMVNLGLAGFFALGAYASALLTVKAGFSIWLGVLAGALFAAAGGVVAAVATRRLRGDYLAIVTLGFAEVLRLVAANETWLTRGADGISGIPRPLRAELGDHFNLVYFIMVSAIVALVWFGVRQLAASPYGRVLRAVRDDPQVAAIAGKNVPRFKIQTFALSATIAGLGGALYGHFISYVAPDIFTPIVTIYIFLAVTAGGAANSSGVVLGAYIVMFILESTRFAMQGIPGLSELQVAALREALIGVLLILLMHLRPQGLMPEPRHYAPPGPRGAA